MRRPNMSSSGGGGDGDGSSGIVCGGSVLSACAQLRSGGYLGQYHYYKGTLFTRHYCLASSLCCCCCCRCGRGRNIKARKLPLLPSTWPDNNNKSSTRASFASFVASFCGPRERAATTLSLAN